MSLQSKPFLFLPSIGLPIACDQGIVHYPYIGPHILFIIIIYPAHQVKNNMSLNLMRGNCMMKAYPVGGC
jgi:hypothetical protein